VRDNAKIEKIITLPKNADKILWVYEHLRFFLMQLNDLVLELQNVCTPTTCPYMIATADWEYRCAFHKAPQRCCAMDYILHTLTGFTALLNNGDMFPTRKYVPGKSAKSFGSLARRLYRVFAHAFFHHRKEFDVFEANTHLTERFITFCLTFRLMDRKTLVPQIKLDNKSEGS